MTKKIQTIGELIKELRESANLSLDKLAEAIGTNRGTIIRWEKGKHGPSRDYAQALGSYFKRPWTDFRSETTLMPTAERRLSELEREMVEIRQLVREVREALRSQADPPADPPSPRRARRAGSQR